MYFYGLLQYKTLGCIDNSLIDKLDKRLKVSGYWSERLEIFGLSIEHLRTGTFPIGGDASLESWNLPEPFSFASTH